ncbi:hypothetical protein ABWH88_16795 [Marinobacter adhaerens]|jgi:ABC-type branched-subunit amino acid transport system ATPase component|uniref:Uncharacterized protein n=1 Tax=Marinobacter adhaerens TaxID=1033846 RepID=A0ABX8IFU8_9GAMM|nr:hypothetical protein [Marinobacter adhaerens]MBW4976861.1 hypothetical protein [Marinobacter adhaerens]QWV12620.1 hypothetical protein KQ249_18425 [Marinobacter adhaerens]
MVRNEIGKTNLMKRARGEGTRKSGGIKLLGRVELPIEKVKDRSRIVLGNSLQSRQIFLLLAAEENLYTELFVSFS